MPNFFQKTLVCEIKQEKVPQVNDKIPILTVGPQIQRILKIRVNRLTTTRDSSSPHRDVSAK
jgi:hypothetical protein